MASKRRAFTLMELLVVIGIIGILLSLIVPAVMMVRESARKLQCGARMAQVGLALQSYHDAVHCYPCDEMYLKMEFPRSGIHVGHQLSRFVRLLPYLERHESYSRFNLDHFLGPLPPNDIPEPLFVCPSDTLKTPTDCNFRWNHGPATFENYQSRRNYGWPDDFTGPLGGRQRIDRAADITDGLTNTVGLSEKVVGDHSDTSFSRSGDFVYGLVCDRGVQEVTSAELRKIADDFVFGSMPIRSDGGREWFRSGFHRTFYNHVTTPNKYTVDGSIEHQCLLETYFQAYPFEGSFRATSRHGGGVNVMTMAGEVRFVSDGIALEIWQALSTRAGGENNHSF